MSHDRAAQLVRQAQASSTAAEKAALLSEAGRLWESLNDLPHAAQAYYQSYTTAASVVAAEGCYRTYRAASKWPGALQWISAALSIEASLSERARLLNEKARLLQNDMGDFDGAQAAYSELRELQQQMAEVPAPPAPAPVAQPTSAALEPESRAPSLQEMEHAAVRNTTLGRGLAVGAVLLIGVVAGRFFLFRTPCPEGQIPNSVTEQETGLLARGCGVDSRLQGRVDLFDRSEQLVGYATYLNGKREGPAEVQIDGGTIHATYVRGVLDGEWRLTVGSTELERRSYRDGKPDGLWERFDPNHRRLHSEEWSKGKLSGFSRDYHPNGGVSVEELFDGGQRAAPAVHFSTAGEMMMVDQPTASAGPTNNVEVLASGGERVFGGHRLESWRSLLTLAALKGKQELVLTRARRAGLRVFEDGGIEP